MRFSRFSYLCIHQPSICRRYHYFGNYNLKRILCCFETWSGLSINFHKSSLVYLNERNLSIATITVFGRKVGSIHVRCLGVSLGLGKLAKMVWALLFDQLERKMEG